LHSISINIRLLRSLSALVATRARYAPAAQFQNPPALRNLKLSLRSI
jgi:hypothetical protein